MGAQNLSLIKTDFIFICRKLVLVIMVLWVSFYRCMFTLFGFIGQLMLRLQGKLMGLKSMIEGQEECNTTGYVTEQDDDDDDDHDHEEESESLLRFRFPTFEEFVRKNDVPFIGDRVLFDNSDGNRVSVEKTRDTLISRNNMVSKSVADMFEPQESLEVTMNTKPGTSIIEPRITSENLCETIGNHIEDSSRYLVNVHVDCEVESSKGTDTEDRVEPSQPVDNLVRHETQYFSDEESLVSDSDSDSDSMVSNDSSFRGSFIDSLSDGFLSDIDFKRAFEIDTLGEYHGNEVKPRPPCLTKADIELGNLSEDCGTDDIKDEDEDILQELKEIEYELDDNFNSLGTEDRMIMESETQSEQSLENRNLDSNLVAVSNTSDTEDKRTKLVNESHVVLDNFELNLVDRLEGEPESNQSSEKSSSGEQLSSDSEEQTSLEREWEHQDLVEQLKMEIKNVRATGLPTILEESESPKIMDDLKPWKIEHKYHHEGTMDELHKFYKSYRERMRKLDILNFQKMYAIGFLRLKDPLLFCTKNKIPVPALSAIVSFKWWPCKPKVSSQIHKPLMEKFTKELESDLETVYVGQMCLSWEFLCWEYGKALELWETDPHGVRCYNEVAGKFQTFQVLLTRFLEEDAFEGPRVQHYAKSRCVLRNLLQVPVIRDDNYRDRKKQRKVITSQDAIKSLQLVETIEQSIRILWQFIHTDKNSTLVKCRGNSNAELQSPADSSLLEDVRSMLQEKQKKLKEVTKTQNCLLRKLNRHHKKEDSSDDVMFFYARVDMKLVSRVLNMSRISTEQLVWCSHKLNYINFVGTKLQLEPSILLFPCS